MNEMVKILSTKGRGEREMGSGGQVVSKGYINNVLLELGKEKGGGESESERGIGGWGGGGTRNTDYSEFLKFHL